MISLRPRRREPASKPLSGDSGRLLSQNPTKQASIILSWPVLRPVTTRTLEVPHSFRRDTCRTAERSNSGPTALQPGEITRADYLHGLQLVKDKRPCPQALGTHQCRTTNPHVLSFFCHSRKSKSQERKRQKRDSKHGEARKKGKSSDAWCPEYKLGAPFLS